MLSQLPTPKQNGSTVFSPACFTHCLSEESTFWGVHVNDVSLRDLVQEWFFEGVISAHPSRTNSPNNHPAHTPSREAWRGAGGRRVWRRMRVCVCGVGSVRREAARAGGRARSARG